MRPDASPYHGEGPHPQADLHEFVNVGELYNIYLRSSCRRDESDWPTDGLPHMHIDAKTFYYLGSIFVPANDAYITLTFQNP